MTHQLADGGKIPRSGVPELSGVSLVSREARLHALTGTNVMSRRKVEITGLMNERDFPHVVELALPPGGFRSRGPEFEAFHRELGIPIRRGRGRHEAEQFYVRFCFPHATAADAFRDRFGGERLIYTPQKPRPGNLKLKSKRIYAPRIVTDHIMLQEDFERLHKFLLETEDIPEVSDDIRELVEEEWPELVPKLPPKAP
jgi:hypothetical protein